MKGVRSIKPAEELLDSAVIRDSLAVSRDEIYREFFRENRKRVRIKKEDLAVRNLMRIFEAALALSNEKGFSAMSMRDLSAETGLSMGALYSYFSSKDELLDMIQRLSMKVIVRVLKEPVMEIDDPHGRLRRAVHTHLYLSEAMYPWFYFSFMETRHLHHRARKRAKETELFTEAIFTEIIAHGQKEGVFKGIDAQLMASMIKGMLQEWYLKRWKYERRKVSTEEYAAALMGLVESRLLA